MIYLLPVVLAVAVLGAMTVMDSEDSEGAVTNPTNATLVGDIWYTIWDGEAIVRGPSSNSLTTITIPSTVTIDGNTYTVTGIAGVNEFNNTGAFMDMFQLTTVTLPYTIESFTAQYDANTANQVYSNCFYLYPSATPNVGHLTTVNWDIPAGETCHLTSIGRNAFGQCNALTTFDIPDSVTEIGGAAFSGCSQYAIHSLPSALTTLGASAFAGTLIDISSLPQSVTEVPNSLFFNCTAITSFTLGDNVTSVGSQVFYGCTNLQSLRLPAGLTEISSSLCTGCTSLTSITMPTNYTSVGNSAFERCSGLHFTLPDGLTSVGEFAFRGCTSMNITSIPSSLTSIPNYAFQGAMGGSRLEIPATVTSIGNYAFGIPTVNGQAVSSMEIIFEGVKGASTTTVTVGNSMFDDTGLLNPPSYPANTTFTITLYGMSYKYGTSSTIRNTCFTHSGNVSFVYNVYSKDTINYLNNGDVANYYATHNGVDYSRVLRTGNDWNAYAIGLADDNVTAVSIPSAFYYYGTGGPHCIVYGVKGSQTQEGYGAFGGSQSLESVTISTTNSTSYYYNPNGNSFRYANTFKDCTNLTSVTYNGVGGIPSGMFYGCTSLQTVSLGSGTYTFSTNAFRDCTSLTMSNVNLVVNTADYCAFSGCVSLNPLSLTLGNNSSASVSIGERAFEGCELINIDYLRATSIGDYAFSGCVSLNPSQAIRAQTIGNYAFENCTGLTSLDFKNNVQIGWCAFYGCSGLTDVTFQSGVQLNDEAFENCLGLDAIIFQGDVDLGESVFNIVYEVAPVVEPTEEQRSLTLMFFGQATYDEYTFQSYDYYAEEDDDDYDDDPYADRGLRSGGNSQAYDRIYDIIDLGDNGFTPQNSGLPEDATVENHITARSISMLQKIEQEEQHAVVNDPSTTSTLMRAIPVFVAVAIIMAVVGTLYHNRTETY